ncbi:2052_t:CDS:2 [Funneliformis geosporum]|nr:2052_t:CDS:2 [Funneliformis geosporum]
MEYISKRHYQAGATYLSSKSLKEIHNSCNKIKNAITPDRIQQLPENFNWDKEIENIYNLYAELPSF